MASCRHYYTCSALIILLGIPSSLCDNGSGDIDDSSALGSSTSIYYATTSYHTLSTVTSSSTLHTTPSIVLSLSLMITPTGTVEDKNSGIASEIVTGIIIGTLMIVLILFVCIIAVASYIIRERKKHTQFMEVSLHP